MSRTRDTIISWIAYVNRILYSCQFLDFLFFYLIFNKCQHIFLRYYYNSGSDSISLLWTFAVSKYFIGVITGECANTISEICYLSLYYIYYTYDLITWQLTVNRISPIITVTITYNTVLIISIHFSIQWRGGKIFFWRSYVHMYNWEEAYSTISGIIINNKKIFTETPVNVDFFLFKYRNYTLYSYIMHYTRKSSSSRRQQLKKIK